MADRISGASGYANLRHAADTKQSGQSKSLELAKNQADATLITSIYFSLKTSLSILKNNKTTA